MLLAGQLDHEVNNLKSGTVYILRRHHGNLLLKFKGVWR